MGVSTFLPKLTIAEYGYSFCFPVTDAA